jgi:membrane-associated phospholipid phosphatase
MMGSMSARARIVFLLLLAAGAMAVFVVLAVAVTSGSGLVDLDHDVSRWVARSMPRWVEWLFLPPTWIGGWVGLTLVSLAVGAVLLREGRAWDALWVVAGIAAIQLLTTAVKEAFERPRPVEGSAIPLPSSWSFPSGHASASVVAAGLTALVVAERGHPQAALASAVVAALAIGGSRIVLNVHYVSDVVAGFALGAAFLALLLLLRDAVSRWSAR